MNPFTHRTFANLPIGVMKELLDMKGLRLVQNGRGEFFLVKKGAA